MSNLKLSGAGSFYNALNLLTSGSTMGTLGYSSLESDSWWFYSKSLGLTLFFDSFMLITDKSPNIFLFMFPFNSDWFKELSDSRSAYVARALIAIYLKSRCKFEIWDCATFFYNGKIYSVLRYTSEFSYESLNLILGSLNSLSFWLIAIIN